MTDYLWAPEWPLTHAGGVKSALRKAAKVYVKNKQTSQSFRLTTEV